MQLMVIEIVLVIYVGLYLVIATLEHNLCNEHTNEMGKQ